MAGLFDELRVLLHGIWNRRWIALAVAWGVAMLGWLGVALIPNSYQSKARVYVNTQSLLEDRMGITQVSRSRISIACAAHSPARKIWKRSCAAPTCRRPCPVRATSQPRSRRCAKISR